MKKTTIIVPVYKSEKYLNRCINSILRQSYNNIELILVDDGSPDRCGAICDEYAEKDNRIKVVHKKNGGVSSARNAGISIATGEYLMFVDSDDWIEDTMVSNLVGLINTNTFDIVLSGIIIKTFVNNSSQIVDIYRMKEKSYNAKLLLEAINEDFNLVCFCGPCGKIYKTNIVKYNNILFNEKIFLGEDTLFVLGYLKYCNKIIATKEIFYNYCRENEESLFCNYNQKAFEFREIVFNEMRKAMNLFNCSDESKRKFEDMYFDILLECLTLDFINFSKSDKKYKVRNIECFMNNQEIRKYVRHNRNDKINNIILNSLIKWKAKNLLYIILRIKFLYRRS